MIDNQIKELLEYKNDHIYSILTESFVSDYLNANYTYYGVFRIHKNYESPDEIDIINYYGSKDPTRAEKNAKRSAKYLMDDRTSEEKRYKRYSAKKLSKKFLASDEFEVFFNKKRFKDMQESIEEDAGRYAKDLGMSERDLQSAFEQMVQDHKLTADDLYDWDWKKFEVLDEESSESISASMHTSAWSTTYTVSIVLNGKEYTSKYWSSGPVNRV